MTALALSMWKTWAIAGWPLNSTCAGRSRAMSALALPISKTVPILALAFEMSRAASAATAASCLASVAFATPIAPPYVAFVPAAVRAVLGANMIEIMVAFAVTVKPWGGIMPDGTRIAALPFPVTDSMRLSGSITTGAWPGWTKTASRRGFTGIESSENAYLV